MPVAQIIPAAPAPVALTATSRARVREAAQGGYRQAAPDGIHPVTREITVEYEGDRIDIENLAAFVRAKRGHQPFFFPLNPEERLLVRCPSWSGPRTEAGHRRALTLSLIEDHSPGYTPAGEGT